MIEYYEGFLIAVDSLKRTGTSVDLYVYNCGDDKASLNTILAKEEMKNMNIIFGPSQSQHVKTLATFAKKHDIRMVIPFSSKEEEVSTTPLFIKSILHSLICTLKYTNILQPISRRQYNNIGSYGSRKR